MGSMMMAILALDSADKPASPDLVNKEASAALEKGAGAAKASAILVVLPALEEASAETKAALSEDPASAMVASEASAVSVDQEETVAASGVLAALMASVVMEDVAVALVEVTVEVAEAAASLDSLQQRRRLLTTPPILKDRDLTKP